MTGIIDYDAGNIGKCGRPLAYLGEDAEVTRDAGKLLAATG